MTNFLLFGLSIFTEDGGQVKAIDCPSCGNMEPLHDGLFLHENDEEEHEWFGLE